MDVVGDLSFIDMWPTPMLSVVNAYQNSRFLPSPRMAINPADGSMRVPGFGSWPVCSLIKLSRKWAMAVDGPSLPEAPITASASDLAKVDDISCSPRPKN